MSGSLHCEECKTILPTEWAQDMSDQKCPKCGSYKQVHKIKLFDMLTVTATDTLNLKEEDDSLPSRKNPRKHLIRGADIRRSDGRIMDKTRLIDKDNDIYHEKIVDPKTKEIIHECTEPLSRHQGHGSAKHTTKKPKQS